VERDAETNKDVFVNDATQQRLGTHPVRVQERRKRRVLTSLGFNCRCSTRRLKLIEKDFSCSSNNSSSSNRRKGKEKKKNGFSFSLLTDHVDSFAVARCSNRATPTPCAPCWLRRNASWRF
jgi:hypothetical protein